VRALAAFRRVHLDSGQSQSVTIHLPLRRFQYWSRAEGKWVKAAGPREIMVGGSSRDLPLDASVSIP
jgi:beta-glucosidase